MAQPFMVDGVALPTPDEYKPGIEDLSSEATGRTLDGVMHKDVVDIKDYYEFSWKSLSWVDAATVFNAVDGKTEVTLVYADPRRPFAWLSNRFYVARSLFDEYFVVLSININRNHGFRVFMVWFNRIPFRFNRF